MSAPERRPPPMVGLVIDKHGCPRFDDPENAPEPQKAMVTDEMIAKMDPDVVRRLGLDNAEYKQAIRGRYGLAPVAATPQN